MRIIAMLALCALSCPAIAQRVWRDPWLTTKRLPENYAVEYTLTSPIFAVFTATSPFLVTERGGKGCVILPAIVPSGWSRGAPLKWLLPLNPVVIPRGQSQGHAFVLRNFRYLPDFQIIHVAVDVATLQVRESRGTVIKP